MGGGKAFAYARKKTVSTVNYVELKCSSFTGMTTAANWEAKFTGGTTGVISNFSIVGDTVKFNITGNRTTFNANNLTITDVNVVNVSSLIYLYLNNNQIVTFNPTIALPSNLQLLYLYNNQIVTFNPTIALPSNLKYLYLYNNQIVTFNPTIALPSSLIYLILSYNQIVTFNPTIALPSSLLRLELNNNQMTTAGYTASEPWANMQPSFTATCAVQLQGNVNSASGTNFKAILETKNCTVTA